MIRIFTASPQQVFREYKGLQGGAQHDDNAEDNNICRGRERSSDTRGRGAR
jgi:hypothetical protein